MNPLAMIPPKFIIGAIVILVLAGGFTWFGYDWAAGKYKKQLADYQTKVTTLHNRLDQLDGDSGTQIIIKYKTKLVHIKDVGDHNANVAKNIVHSTCNVASGWVSTHDAAATGNKVDPISGANATDSGIKDTEALATISDNYKTFHDQKEQLDRIQEEIVQHNANIDKANAEVKKKKHWWNK